MTTALALFLILASGGGDGDVASDERGGSAPAQTTEAAGSEEPAAESDEGGGSSGKKGPKRYTVEPGDTPSGIAEKTGVPLEELLDLNPEVDPQTLTPGQKLRLR